MKGALSGFLGTYSGRNSDYRGYWLHGQLSFGTPQYEFNLLVSPSADDSPEGFAWRLANRRFADQVTKAGLTLEAVAEATLRIQMQPEIVNGRHGGRRSDGHMVQLEVSALMDNGRRFVRQQTIFVAAHDPSKERRRLPHDWGT